jgi:hypothetical protein
MRQDKDRSAKWLIANHGDSILKLAGLTGFTSWRAVETETVAPRRLPDGLLEVQFADSDKPTLVLIEIETYPDRTADRQVFDDLMLIALERRVIPEVVSVVLRPKGNVQLAGGVERASPRGTTQLTGAWPVVRLWDLSDEELLQFNDVGLVPWLPLTQTARKPEEVLDVCWDRIAAVPDATKRESLLSVTVILASLVFDGALLRSFFGGRDVVEFPIIEEAKEMVRKKVEAETRVKVEAETTLRLSREDVLFALDIRFGPVPPDVASRVNELTDLARLKSLHRAAIVCPGLDDFRAELDRA